MISNQKFTPEYYISKLKLRAKFLKNKLSITTSESQMLLANYYQFTSWGLLAQSIISSQVYQSKMFEDEYLLPQAQRQKYETFIANVLSQHLDVFSGLYIKENTVLHCLKNKNFNWLNDHELAHLYSWISDYGDKTEVDISSSELIESLIDCNNDVAVRVQHNIKTNSILNNVHLEDRRYCIKLYMDFRVKKDNKIDVIFRELDLPLYRFKHPSNRISFINEKFSQYFIQKLVITYIIDSIASLKKAGFSGNILLENICSTQLHNLSNKSSFNAGLFQMLDQLTNIGAKKNNFFHSDSKEPTELSLAF